jgi:divalent metal cation (Fe/Co/Zn/Cd) transporter
LFPDSSSRSVLYSSIAADLLIGLTRFAAAFFTGSSAMLSEGIHSIVDTGNGILVLYGLRRAAVHPDHEHPLGYGREVYFGALWSRFYFLRLARASPFIKVSSRF